MGTCGPVPYGHPVHDYRERDPGPVLYRCGFPSDSPRNHTADHVAVYHLLLRGSDHLKKRVHIMGDKNDLFAKIIVPFLLSSR